MIGLVISWIFCGLIVGAIARLLHPGRDSMGWVGTIILGILGALLGGGVAYLFGYREAGVMHWPGWIMSILGAIVLLAMGVFGSRTRNV